MGIIKYFRKKYWEAAIFRGGRRIPFSCDGLAAVPDRAYALFTEKELEKIYNDRNEWGATLYAGVMSCGVAYTLQIVGQKNMNPTVASLILSLESCISVLAGWIILGQKLSTREIIGCVVMFGAIVLAQLPQKETASEK